MNITHIKAVDQALNPFILKECEASPSADKLGSLTYLARNLAGSLREWQTAA